MILKKLTIGSAVFALIAVAQPLSALPPLEAEEKAPEPESEPVLPPLTPAPRIAVPAAVAEDAPPGYVYWKTVRARVTAYDPGRCCCAHWAANHLTSTGDNAWVMDGVAADPRALPYRTKLWIPGAGWREVDDTGSAMRQAWRRGRYLVDLRMHSYEKARQWGRRDMTLHLYRPLPR